MYHKTFANFLVLNLRRAAGILLFAITQCFFTLNIQENFSLRAEGTKGAAFVGLFYCFNTLCSVKKVPQKSYEAIIKPLLVTASNILYVYISAASGERLTGHY